MGNYCSELRNCQIRSLDYKRRYVDSVTIEPSRLQYLILHHISYIVFYFLDYGAHEITKHALDDNRKCEHETTGVFEFRT